MKSNKEKYMKNILALLILTLCLISTHSYRLSCAGRTGYLKITISNNAAYTPQFSINYNILLDKDETIEENVTISLST